jgi:hypothetical protein
MHLTIAPHQIDALKSHHTRQLVASAASIRFIAGHSLAPAARGLRPSFIGGRSITTLLLFKPSKRAVGIGIICFMAWGSGHRLFGGETPETVTRSAGAIASHVRYGEEISSITAWRVINGMLCLAEVPIGAAINQLLFTPLRAFDPRIGAGAEVSMLRY